MSQDTVFGNRALCSAVLWWEQLRPIEWTEAQHLTHPAVNTNGMRERELAEDVAKYVQEQRRMKP